jgi:hypothetical protein
MPAIERHGINRRLADLLAQGDAVHRPEVAGDAAR